MGRFEGKVAFVTGAARGQGRSHAVQLAREGADLLLLDLCEQIPSVPYGMSTQQDLDETCALIEKEGQKALAVKADVRDFDAVCDVVRQGLETFGHLDHVVANAGIMPTIGPKSHGMDAWHACVDTMLTGVYYTIKASFPTMVESGRGGSMVITGSTSSFRGVAYNIDMLNPGQVGYGAAKHGVLAIMKNFAMALGPHNVRINLVAPMGVRTPMVVNEFFSGLTAAAPPGWMANALQVGLVEPQDITNAILWLLSDEARYVTGTTIAVDSGQLLL